MGKIVLAVFIAVVLLFIFYFRTMRAAQQETAGNLAKFREIEEQLNSMNDSAGGNKGIGAIQNYLPNTFLNSETILLTDSLIQQYEENTINIPALKSNATRLLHNMQDINKFKWANVDSVIPDTIAYWGERTEFTYEKWFKKYFQGNTNESTITYLRSLKENLIRNN